MKAVLIATTITIVAGFRAKWHMKAESPMLKQAITGAIAGIFAFGAMNMPAGALTKDEIASLSYEQVKGSGLANRCPSVTPGDSTPIQISSGKKLKIVDLCLEPTSWQVEEEVGVKKGEPVKEFVNTKLMTRQTYTLEQVSGPLEIKDGKATFTETDGIDYAATTVQTPGGERVPFLFTVKQLVAKSSSAGPIKPGFDLGGSYTVPSYRSGLFLDPKGRGIVTGYDFAGALPGLQTGTEEDELQKENNKKFDVFNGNIEFSVNTVNGKEGEFGGIFVANQPSDTDLGGKTPKDLLIKGVFYGRVAESS